MNAQQCGTAGLRKIVVVMAGLASRFLEKSERKDGSKFFGTEHPLELFLPPRAVRENGIGLARGTRWVARRGGRCGATEPTMTERC